MVKPAELQPGQHCLPLGKWLVTEADARISAVSATRCIITQNGDLAFYYDSPSCSTVVIGYSAQAWRYIEKQI